MLFTLEALQANDGDCLILHYQKTAAGQPTRVLIDGGSAGVYSSILKKRIDQLRAKKPLAHVSPTAFRMCFMPNAAPTPASACW